MQFLSLFHYKIRFIFPLWLFQEFIFDFLKFSYDMPKCSFFFFFFLVGGGGLAFILLVLWASCILILCLTIIGRNSQWLLLQILFFCPFLSFSSWYSCYAYFIAFVVVPQVLDILFPLFIFFLFASQFLKFLWTYPHAQRFFSIAIFSLVLRLSKAFLVSVTVVLISIIPFLLFLRLPISLLYLPICSFYMLLNKFDTKHCVS